ncbi:MAG: flagellar basal body protein, partial [Aeromonas jandaei]
MSFSIGLSGLRAVNQELSVISNNVANASTAG